MANVVVKVPVINATGKTDGCEEAPASILTELEDFYTNEEGGKVGYELSVIAVDNNNLEETNNEVTGKAKEIMKDNKAIFLGGDHSVSYALVKAFFQENEGAGLVVLDAHADCMHNFNPPTHEDWVRTLIEEGHVKPEQVILVGLRNLHEIEKEFLDEHKINTFTCKEIYNNGFRESALEIMQATRKFKNLYLSIDIDIADAVFTPGVSYPEPGGLSSRELLHLIQKLMLLKNLRAADIVEVNPAKDKENVTAKLAAKLIPELLS